MRRFEDKVVLITGAARGLGKQTAVLFAKEGASVCVADIDYDGVRKVEKDLIRENVDAISVKADISDVNDIRNMVDVTVKKFSKIDILVNNAAIPIQKSMMDIEWEDWDLLLNVNIKGTFFVLQTVAREMIESGTAGSIVNISSIAGEGGRPFYIPYAATKAAIINMTQSTAKELAKYNIRVNSVSPGNIDTQMLRDFADKVAELENTDVSNILDSWVNKIPLKHFAKPEEIANAVLFLSSDEASYITGQILDVCGGLSIP